MSNELQEVYTIIAMTKRFLNPEQTEPTNPQTYQVLISSADRQLEKWLTIDRNSWENFTLGGKPSTSSRSRSYLLYA